jgi:hypothetical protein
MNDDPNDEDEMMNDEMGPDSSSFFVLRSSFKRLAL